MWIRELLKNKIYSILLIAFGAFSIFIEYDLTFFIFALMVGMPLFLAKENWITETGTEIVEIDTFSEICE